MRYRSGATVFSRQAPRVVGGRSDAVRPGAVRFTAVPPRVSSPRSRSRRTGNTLPSVIRSKDTTRPGV